MREERNPGGEIVASEIPLARNWETRQRPVYWPVLTALLDRNSQDENKQQQAFGAN